jgi:hypothetical protein
MVKSATVNPPLATTTKEHALSAGPAHSPTHEPYLMIIPTEFVHIVALQLPTRDVVRLSSASCRLNQIVSGSAKLRAAFPFNTPASECRLWR